jgi:uncharacterized membrane protein
LTAAPPVFIIFSCAVACYAARKRRGAVAMIKNVVAGLVLVALVIMGVLAFAQKHDGCLHGRELHTFKPCGSMSSRV